MRSAMKISATVLNLGFIAMALGCGGARLEEAPEKPQDIDKDAGAIDDGGDEGVAADDELEIADKKLALGLDHSCTIKEDANVYCWGSSEFAQLGRGASDERNHARPVAGLSDIVSISAGGHFTCAISRAGQVFCFGLNLDRYPLTLDGTLFLLEPTAIEGWEQVAEVAVGATHSCALHVDGTVSCLGWNDRGQLGLETAGEFPTDPVRAPAVAKVARISAGVSGAHNCVRFRDGSAACFGANTHGQHGTGKLGDSSNPTPIDLLKTSVVEIAAGGTHSCALLVGGEVSCWGLNQYGQLGDGSVAANRVPNPVPGLEDIASIATGAFHSCALHSHGGVSCWGKNEDGQLGDGTNDNRKNPTPIPKLSDVVELSLSYRHSCARLADGNIMCWGANDRGQLGDGTSSDGWSPVLVEF